jgi:hypothetical protein
MGLDIPDHGNGQRLSPMVRLARAIVGPIINSPVWSARYSFEGMLLTDRKQAIGKARTNRCAQRAVRVLHNIFHSVPLR